MRPTLLCVAACLAASMSSHALGEEITYAFHVAATDGPLAGAKASGLFSYDSSIVAPGVTLSATGLLTSLTFTWNGIAYDATSANTGFLSFDGAGQLVYQWAIGNNCGAGNCGTSIVTESWFIGGNPSPPLASFHYCANGGCGEGSATVRRVPTPAMPVPVMTQPVLILALCASILGLAIRRRPGLRTPSSGPRSP